MIGWSIIARGTVGAPSDCFLDCRPAAEGGVALNNDVKSFAGPSADQARLLRAATYASVGTAGVLIVVKFAAWQMTGSLSLLAALLDSVLDAAASLINLFAVRHALQPPDAEHRFGHGKAEPLAALGQAAFICGSALFLLVEAAPRLVAKGRDFVARRIREIAKEHGVPIVENPPLARALDADVELDAEIPPHFYQAVAEVIGYVMGLRRSGGRTQGGWRK